MSKDLTVSQIDRQNILNNTVAIQRIRQVLEIAPVEYKGVYYLTKQMVADFYEVDIKTISRCLDDNEAELRFNGYTILQGNSLNEFKLCAGKDIHVPTKTTILGIFDLRSFLNIGMLLTRSEKAKQLRAMMLDMVIAVINEKTGGGTKFINWRDRDFLPAAIQEEDYHKNLTSAIKKYVDGHQTYKYSQVQDMIYKAVFCEKADEYRRLLQLSEKDNVRRTLYAEVLRVVSSFENGVAYEIQKIAEAEGPLTIKEVQAVVDDMAKHPLQAPYIYDARQKMASRDNAFRNVTHEELLGYLKALSPEEFDKFIGERSIDIEALLNTEENRAFLQTLN